MEILDQKLGGWTDEDIARRVAEGGYRVLGLSYFSVASGRAASIARLVRRLAPATPIVIGGPHVNAFMEHSMSEPAFTYGIYGEGEKSFAALIDQIIDGGGIEELPGLIWRRPDGVVVNEPAPVTENLDELPWMAWDKLYLRPYWRREGFNLMGRRPYLPMFSSRGCPFACSYCHHIFGKKYRARSPENVVAEMTELARRYGVREFEFIDDTFNLQEDRAREIFARLRRELPGVRILFPNGLRTDIMTPEFIDDMAATGVYYASFAFESGSPRIQEVCGKRLKLEAAQENLKRCAEKGLYLNGYFMLGFPTETHEEMEQTISFAVNSALHTAAFFCVMPNKGTPLYKSLDEKLRALADGLAEHMYYDSPFINLSAVSDAELALMQREALRRFYMAPGRLWRMFRDHPRPHHFAYAFLDRVAMKMWFQLRRLGGARRHLSIRE